MKPCDFFGPADRPTYELRGGYRIVSTYCTRGGCLNFIQEYKDGEWRYKLDSCGVPMACNYKEYAQAFCDGKLKWGQYSIGDERKPAVMSQGQIIRQLRKETGKSYFHCWLLAYKHRNRWGFFRAAAHILRREGRR